MRINFRELDAFIMVARELSFSRAAELLGVSQPRLSFMIRQLELRIGISLFKRDPRKVELTEDGAEILTKALAAKTALDALSDTIAARHRLATNVLRIAASTSSSRVPQRLRLLSLFRNSYPGINIDVADERSDRALVMLIQRQVDVALMLRQPAPAEIEQLAISRSRCCLYLRSDHPWASKETIPCSDLKDAELHILPRPQDPIYWTSYGPIIKAGAKLTSLYEPTLESLVDQVQRRNDVGLKYVYHEQEPPGGDVIVRPVEGEGLENEFVIARHVDSVRGPTEWLWKLAREFAPVDPRTPDASEGVMPRRLAS